MRATLIVSFVLGSTVLGCAATSPFVYPPEEQASASIEGRAAARYGVPPQAATGSVRVALFGVKELRVEGSRPLAVLHARIVIANDTDQTPYSVESSHLYASIGQARLAPALVKTEGACGAGVARGERCSLDVYFALPRGLRTEDRIASCDIGWELSTGVRIVGGRTPFLRQPARGPAYGYEPSVWPGVGADRAWLR
jgi:hypothetical protein